MRTQVERLDEEEDDDFDFDIDVVEIGEGHATPAVESDEVGDLLLEMASASVRLLILMNELDHEGWNAIVGRYKSLASILAQLPTEAPAAKRVGFVRD